MPRDRRVHRPRFDSLDDRALLSGFTPAQIRTAYGLDAIAFDEGGRSVAGDGRGQTIAVVVAYHAPDLAADLDTFSRTFGLPEASLTQVNLAGAGAATDDAWAGEAALDVEWAHAIAPGADLIVVEARSDSAADMLAAVDVARHLPDVSVVSMSWGGPESEGLSALDAYFTTPSGHEGVTFVASSGDSGPARGAEWPASSPNVLAVGGTTLRVDAAGIASGESAWALSGGGLSRHSRRPGYQKGVQSTGKRSTPDVAFVGDPATGGFVYATPPSTGRGAWRVVGGTSLGAPAWAGIIAIVDQGLATLGRGSLDGPSQALPALYALPKSDFHAVRPARAAGGARATLSSTGLGTPVGDVLVSHLVQGVEAAPTIPIVSKPGRAGRGRPRPVDRRVAVAPAVRPDPMFMRSIHPPSPTLSPIQP